MRCFTPQSARRTALRLTPVASSLCRDFRTLQEALPQRCAEAPVDRRYFFHAASFYRHLGQLQAAGIVACDPLRRRFEFPARRDGREVRLCWQLDSPAPFGWREARQGAPIQPLSPEDRWERGGVEIVG